MTTGAVYSPVQLSVAGVNNFVAVSAGRRHSLAMTSNGTLYAWGNNLVGQLGDGTIVTKNTPTRIFAVPLNTRQVTSIQAGQYHSLALTHDGMVLTWGYCDQGQLGDNYQTSHYRIYPRFVLGTLTGQFLVDIGVALTTGYALTENGVIYAWGRGASGEYGDGTTASPRWLPSTPATFPSGVVVTELISSSVTNSAMAQTNSTGGFLNVNYYGWGDNTYGKFAFGTTSTAISTPLKIPNLFPNTTAVSVAVSDHAIYTFTGITCYGVFADDTYSCTGHGTCIANDTCVCDSGFVGPQCNLPMCFGQNASDPTVCNGYGQCMMIDTCICYKGYHGTQCTTLLTGIVYSSGNNNYGQLGANSINGNAHVPTQAILFSSISAVEVAAGFQWTLVLSKTGVVYSVGMNDAGQLGDGTVLTRWNTISQIGGLLTGVKVVDVCAGWKHALAIDSNGKLYSWGYNNDGELGNGASGASANSNVPIRVLGDLYNQTVVQVACGTYHSAVLTFNGTVYTFGYGSNGQIGNGLTTAVNPYPVQVYLNGVVNYYRVVQVAAGLTHTTVLGQDGVVYSWGLNDNGQLGDATTSQRLSPVISKGALTNNIIVQVSAGGYTSHAIDINGRLYGWGNSANGNIGNGGTTTLTTPTLVTANISAVFDGFGTAVGINMGFAIQATSKLVAFGYGNDGELGTGRISNAVSQTPYNVNFPNRTVVFASASPSHSVVLYDNTVTCFNILPDEPGVCDYHGTCTGIDTCSCSSTYSGTNCNVFTCNGVLSTDPTVCASHGVCMSTDNCVCNTGVTGSNCDIKIFGSVYSLGSNSMYQLGDENLVNTRFAVKTVGYFFNRIVSKVDAGTDYSMGLGLDGNVYVWGSNANSQIVYSAVGLSTSRSRPYILTTSNDMINSKAGPLFGFSVRSNGDVWSWGNGFGSGGVPAKLSGLPASTRAKTIAVGAGHGMILTYNGTLYGAGVNTYSNLGNGLYASSSSALASMGYLANKFFIDVECGDSHCLALSNRGEIYSWGYNSRGQLGDGTTVNKNNALPVYGALSRKLVIAIAAGYQSSFAITIDGSLYAWGGNDYGILGIGSTVDQYSPVLVTVPSNAAISSVSVSKNIAGHAVALSTAGVAYGWGLNTYGQIGDTTTTSPRTTPTFMNVDPSTGLQLPLTSGNSIVGLAAGNYHTLILVNGTFCNGILSTDTLVCAGRGICVDNDICSCYPGFTGNNCQISICFNTLSTSTSVCSGNGTCVANNTCVCRQGYTGAMCAMQVAGYVYSIGDTSQNVLADNNYYTATTVTVPVMTASPLLLGTFISQIIAGNDYTFAITTSGNLYAWGTNRYGNMGIGNPYGTSTLNFPLPTQVMPGTKFVSVSTNLYHTAFVDTSGNLWTVGWNSFAWTNVPSSGSTTSICSYTGNSALCKGNTSPYNAVAPSTYTGFVSNPPTPPASNTLTCTQTTFGYYGTTYSGCFSCCCSYYAGYSYSCGYYYCSVTSYTSYYTYTVTPCTPTSCPCNSGWINQNYYVDNTPTTTGQLGIPANFYTFAPLQITNPPAGETFVQVSAGLYHTIATTASGRVYAFGRNVEGQLGTGSINQYEQQVVLSGGSAEFGGWLYNRTAIRVQAGDYHSMVLLDRGDLYSFGSNNYGQLGDNSQINRLLPRQVRYDFYTTPATSFSAGIGVSFATTSDGRVESWGKNLNQVLGLGITSTAQTQLSPAALYITNATSVITSSVNSNAMLVTTGGTTYGWGTNPSTMLGDLTTTQRSSPVLSYKAFKASYVSQAALGYRHTAFIINNQFNCFNVYPDDITVCGSSGTCIAQDTCVCNNGYTGANCTIPFCNGINATSPTVCNGNGFCVRNDWCQCYTGYSGPNCTLLASFVFSTGTNSNYELGDGLSITPRFAPLQAQQTVKQTYHYLLAGNGYSFAFNLNSKYTIGWGANDRGQLALGTTSAVIYPTQTLTNLQFAKIVACEGHVISLDLFGKVRTWGNNANSQIGDGTITNWLIPYNVSFTTNETIIDVTCSATTSMAVSRNGLVYTWGSNAYSQLGRVVSSNAGVPVRIADGLIVKRAIRVAAGELHSTILCDDGTIYSVGYNNYGQLGDGTASGTIRTIVYSSPYFTLRGQLVVGLYANGPSTVHVLHVNNTLYSWGANSYGQIGDGTFTDRYTPVRTPTPYPIAGFSVGYNFAMVINTINTSAAAHGWGSNSYGQIGDGSITNRATASPVNGSVPTLLAVASAPGRTHTLFSFSAVSCFGYMFNDPLVCSQRGNCTAQDICQCTPMYFSSDCSVKLCFSRNSSDPLVCSGVGICISLNTCSCKQGYFGTNCQYVTSGYVYASGDDYFGQIGDRNILGYNPYFIQASSLKGISINIIAAGYYTTIFKASSGLLYGLGLNQYGTLGNNTVSSSNPIISPISIFPQFTNNVIGMCLGWKHGMLMDNNGYIYTWGTNEAGIGQIGNGSTTASVIYNPVRINGGAIGRNTSMWAVTCGYEHSVALSTAGVVYAWGRNDYGQVGDNTVTNRGSPIQVGGLFADVFIVSVAAGQHHTVAMANDGQIYTWGYNINGQIGDGTQSNRMLPVRLRGSIAGVVMKSITAGYDFSACVEMYGSVYTWGSNAKGQIGINSTASVITAPIRVNVPTTVSTIAAGGGYIIALADNGTIYGWGDAQRGELGNGVGGSGVFYRTPQAITKPYSLVNITLIVASQAPTGSGMPQPLSGPTSYQLWAGTTCYYSFIEDPAACSYHGTCIAQDTCLCQSLYNGADCGGFNCFGINITDPSVCNSKGACVAADTCVCRPGYGNIDCSFVTTGFAFSLGAGSRGQMGDTYSFNYVLPSPVGGVLGGKVVSSIAAGTDFTVAAVYGSVYSWGANDNGQLGDGTYVDKFIPVAVTGLSVSATYKLVAAGVYHAAAADTNGRVWTWGYNFYGQLGSGSLTNRPSAAIVGGVLATQYVIAVKCGIDFTTTLTSNGTVFSFGGNSKGQMGDGTNTVRQLPVQSGVGVIDKLSIAAITAGYQHVLIIGPFGVVYAWGDNSRGQIGDGTSGNQKFNPVILSDKNIAGKVVVSVAASQLNSYAVTANNFIISWGDNLYGQLGINYTSQYQSPSILSSNLIANPTLVAAGAVNAFVYNSTGAAESWGLNTVGEIGNGLSGVRAITPNLVVNPYSGRLIYAVAPGAQHTSYLYNATACFGYLSDDPNVCSQRGTCVASDTCLCQPGFMNYDCSIVMCGGVNSTDPTICNNNGFCLPNDFCVCNEMYSGRYCDVLNFGFIFGAGQDQIGQLGTGDMGDRNILTKSKGAGINTVPIKQVTGGLSFTLFVTNDNRVLGFGGNNVGQMGDTTSTSAVATAASLSLLPRSRNATLVSVSAGTSFGSVVLSDYSVWTWGYNSVGQLGIGSTSSTPTRTPVQLSGLTGVKAFQVSCGDSHCLLLTKDGSVWSWGANSNGQLGDGTATSAKTGWLPYKILGILAIKNSVTVFAATYHSMTISQDGVVYAWGDNSYGQLGNNATYSSSSPRLLPDVVNVPGMVVGVTGGDTHSCALNSIGAVYCWGSNTYGQIGDGTTKRRLLPTKVIGLTNTTIVKIASSRPGHVIALSNAGVVYTWGSNSNGQLSNANSSITFNSVPTIVVPPVTTFSIRNPSTIGTGNYGSFVLYNGTACYNVLQDDPEVCSGNGTCITTDSCTCGTGFSGYQCQFTSCWGTNMTDATVCSGHGVCKYLNTCICEQDKFTGPNCEYFSCNGFSQIDPMVCSGNGACVGSNNCSCLSTYTGNNCQYKMCFGRNETDPKVCSGVGLCYVPNDCLCYPVPAPGYTGGNCSYPICTSRFYSIKTGIATIILEPQSTTDLLIDISNVCSGNGVCVTPNKCTCRTGWTDQYCSTPICGGRNASDPLVCNTGANGTCISPNNCTCLTYFQDGICQPLTCYGKNSSTGIPPCNSQYDQGTCVNIDVCYCMEGYGGRECEQYVCSGIPQYNSSVCHSRGTCVQGNTCSCNPGFSGQNCEFTRCFQKLNNDATVCSGNGVCVAPDTCSCNTGFEGNICQVTNCYGTYSNQSSVCTGHGRCIAPDTCFCNPGYYGKNCSRFQCFGLNYTSPGVCNGHGACIDYNNCSCTSQYTDIDCSMPVCFGVSALPSNIIHGINTCSGYGLCVAPDTCSCMTQYRVGANCNINVCFDLNATDPNVCNGAGNCMGPNKCNCTNGSTGLDCKSPTCYGKLSTDPSSCSGHGICVLPNTCMCTSDWGGSQCQYPVCYGLSSTDPFVCSSHGRCVSPMNCSCNFGYADYRCSTPICYGLNATVSSVCSSHGTCSDLNTCQCSIGYVGSDCSIPVCYGIPANDSSVCTYGNGQCVSSNRCNCSTGYTGSLCQTPICYGIAGRDPSVCSGNGNCTAIDNCVCKTGRTGLRCELNICFGINQTDSLVCSGNGVCVSPNTCTCQTGYYGSMCDVSVCYSIAGTNSSVCNGQGSCVAPNQCVCNGNYTGTQCTIPFCYGINSTDSTVCSGQGSCVGHDKCICSFGYTSDNCSIPLCYGRTAYDPTVCTNQNGTCISKDACVCNTGYTGSQCQLPYCFGIITTDPTACSAYGTCVDLDNCACVQGRTGPECQYKVCYNIGSNDPTVCSSRGLCLSPDTCACNEGFTGGNCEGIICYDSDTFNTTGPVCNGHGTCVAPNQCICNNQYTGDQCSDPICFGYNVTDPLICSTRGICKEPDTCACFDGYTGIDCGAYVCYGISSLNSSVCNGNGDCVGPDTCVCNANYTGLHCDVPNCFGIAATDPSVCSQLGTCVAPDICSCNTGYRGDQCDVIICFDSDTLNSTGPVCSGNGTCVAPNTCVCNAQHSGQFCNGTVCFGISNSTACSGVGLCIDLDNCVCPDGYTGLNCEQNTCFGTNANDATVCYGHGSCVGPNQCNCTAPYGGTDCHYPVGIVLTSTTPSAAALHDVIKLGAIDLSQVVCPMECVFIYNNVQTITTPYANDTLSVTCVNSIQANHDDIIYITVRCVGETTSTNVTELYIRYIDNSAVTQFNVSQLSCVDSSEIPGVIGCPQNLTMLDQNTLMISSEFNSSSKGRRALRSLNPAPMLNQQAIVEFAIDTSTTAGGNVIESWISTPGSFLVAALNNQGTRTLNMLVNITGNTDFETSVCPFQYGTSYRVYFMLSQKELTWTVICQLLLLPSLKQECLASFDIPTSWKLDPTSFFSKPYTVIVAQSNIPLTAAGASRRKEERAVLASSQSVTGSMTINLNRVAIECQPGMCGTTTAPTTPITDPPTSEPIIPQSLDWVVYLLGGGLAGVGILAILLIIVLVVCIIRRRRRTKQVYVVDENENESTNVSIDMPKDTVRVMDEDEEAAVFNLVSKNFS
jgi:alpha-tubulin suppressor-like RCC1 family protein